MEHSHKSMDEHCQAYSYTILIPSTAKHVLLAVAQSPSLPGAHGWRMQIEFANVLTGKEKGEKENKIVELLTKSVTLINVKMMWLYYFRESPHW